MKDYRKNMRLALVCFLLVVVLNFFLPRLLPGNPVAYLTGFSEQDMTPAQVAYYEDALHLNKSLPVQFGYYLRSLLDGTLGYSYKKDAAVSALIGEKIGYTLQITVPAVLLSAGIGLLWGLRCGYEKDSLADRFSTTALIILNAVPTFLIGLGLDDRVLLSKPVATLYRAQFSGGCARYGWACMGQSSAFAAAGRNLNAGGASQPVSACAQHGSKRVGRKGHFVRKAAGTSGQSHPPGVSPALDCAAVSHDARHERVALRGRLGRD